jgi:hypothetical protein
VIGDKEVIKMSVEWKRSNFPGKEQTEELLLQRQEAVAVVVALYQGKKRGTPVRLPRAPRA